MAEAVHKLLSKVNGPTPSRVLPYQTRIEAGWPDCLHKLRLLCEDFPRSHILMLIGKPSRMQSLALTINQEIRSRVTYSAILPRLAPEAVEPFVWIN